MNAIKSYFVNEWQRTVVWYHTKVQTWMSSVLLGISGADLLTAMTSYEHDLVTLIGAKWHAAIRLAASAVILYRARQAVKK